MPGGILLCAGVPVPNPTNSQIRCFAWFGSRHSASVEALAESAALFSPVKKQNPQLQLGVEFDTQEGVESETHSEEMKSLRV